MNHLFGDSPLDTCQRETRSFILSFLLSFFCPHRYLTNLTNVDSTIVEATETTVALEHDELRTMQSLSGHFLRKIMRSRATHASRRNEPMPVAELHARCRSMDVPNYHPQHEHAERRPRATANAKWGCWRAQSPQQRARAKREQGRQARHERGG